MLPIQHGVGLTLSATSTPTYAFFGEGGVGNTTHRRARKLSIKNKGAATVHLLINASDNSTELVNQFTNLQPLIVESGDTLEVTAAELSEESGFTGIGYKTAVNTTATLIVNAM